MRYHSRHGRAAPTPRTTRVARLVLGAAVVMALVVAGAILLGRGDDSPTTAHGPAPRTSDLAAPAPTSTPSANRLIGSRTGDVLVLPTLKVRAPLVSVRMSRSGVLSPPRDPTEVGYWSGSSTPGSGQGQTLVTGHTVHTGGGALDRLGSLEPGSRVVIHRTTTTGGRFTYRVSSVRTYSKAELARSAQDLFGQDHGAGRLQLVTCTGWDGHKYSGNVVVTAIPVTS